MSTAENNPVSDNKQAANNDLRDIICSWLATVILGLLYFIFIRGTSYEIGAFCLLTGASIATAIICFSAKDRFHGTMAIILASAWIACLIEYRF
jgi:hypothetical protein